MIQKILRIYSYLFVLALSGVCLALALVSKLTGTPLAMDNLPWKGDEAINWLVGIGLFGLIAVAAAVSGSRFRFLLPIVCLIQLFVLVKGNFAGAHSFDGQPEFQKTVELVIASVIATLASLLQLKKA